jgi:hypothetical protein
MQTFLIIVVFLSLFVAMVGIRLFLVKDGEFRGTCSTHNPLLAEKGVDCGTCPNRYKDDCALTKAQS